jgi:hypothetical protein
MEALTNTKHCSQNFNNYSVQISLFLYIHFFWLGPDATQTQYLTQTALTSSTFTLSSNTRPMLRRSTTSPVTCEHKNRSLVNTRIPRYTPIVSPWHGSLVIRSLPLRGKTSSPSAVALWHGSLAIRWTPIVLLYYRPVSARRTPDGRTSWVDSRYPLDIGLYSVVSLLEYSALF